MIYLLNIIASLLAVMVVLTLHEFAHAFVAYKCGDPTAKMVGRMTLNPIRHFDPMGLCLFVFARFGWAKPVPVNPNNFKNRVWGSFLTSAAGIFVNYLSAALVFYPVLFLTAKYVLPLVAGKYIYYFLSGFTGSLFWSSIYFSVFNFLPIYPLDGFNLIAALNKKRGKFFTFLRNYSQYVLIGLLVIDILSDYVTFFNYINLLGYLMSFGSIALLTPINWFWSLIFGL